VGDTRPAQEADGCELDADILEPRREGAPDQEQWQTGGEAEEGHSDDLGLGVDRPGGALLTGFVVMAHACLSLLGGWLQVG